MGKNGVIKNCNACLKEFYVALYRIETARFCSKICQNHKQYKKYKFICEGCGKNCETSPSRKNYRKKFCSLECREHKAKNDKERRKYQKSSALSKRGNVKTRTLRKYISQFKKMQCEYCGYDEYEFCLDMHHLDHDPTNNTPENIGILCCICHRKLHKNIINLGDKNAFITRKEEYRK